MACLESHVNFADAFDLGNRLLDSDRTGRAGHARYGQRDGLGGGPDGGNNGGEGEGGKQFLHGELRSVEKWHDVGKSERDQNQRGHDPENELVSSSHLGNRADLTRFAGRCLPVDAPPGEEQRHQRHADKDGAIGFQHRQVADPSAAEPQGDQNQRPEAASRGEDGGKPSSEERAAPGFWFRHALVLSN